MKMFESTKWSVLQRPEHESQVHIDLETEAPSETSVESSTKPKSPRASSHHINKKNKKYKATLSTYLDTHQNITPSLLPLHPWKIQITTTRKLTHRLLTS